MLKLLNDKGFWKTTFRLATPIVLQNILISSFTLADTLFVSQLGDVSLSAVGMICQWGWLLNMALIGISSGTSVFIAQYWGIKEIKKITRKEEIKPVLVDIEKMQENDHTHRKALQALLRDRLYKIHAECFERGYTTLEDRENFRNLYTQYHGLGQNGVMDNTYKKMFELATEEEWKKNQEQYI